MRTPILPMAKQMFGRRQIERIIARNMVPDLRSITALPGVVSAKVVSLEEKTVMVVYTTSAAASVLLLLPGTLVDGSNNADEESDVVMKLHAIPMMPAP